MSELENTSSVKSSSVNPKQLSALRESKNLTVSDISQRTRLSLKQVDLLESGQYSALPGSAFVMGALRSYCKVVGIEPDTYLQEAKATFSLSQGQELPTPDSLHTSLPSRASGGLESSSSRLWWVASAGLGIIAIGLYFANPNGLSGLIKKDADKAAARSTSATTVVETAPAVTQPLQAGASTQSATSALPAGSPSQTNAPGSPVPSPSNTNESAPPAATASGVSPAVAANSAAPVSSTIAAPVTTGSKSIEVSLTRDAWIDVKDSAGKSLVNRLFKAGAKETIEVPGPVSVTVGSASGVNLNWSGSPFDMKPFIKDDVARFTLK
jgi:cytoskeleton protein RodZ